MEKEKRTTKSIMEIISFVILIILVVVIYGIKIYEEIEITKLNILDLETVTIKLKEINTNKSSYGLIDTESSNKYYIEKIITTDEVIDSLNPGDTLELKIHENDILSLSIIQANDEVKELINFDASIKEYKDRLTREVWIVPSVIILLVLLLFILPKILEKHFLKKYQEKEVDYNSEKNIALYSSIKNSLRYDGKNYYGDLNKLLEEDDSFMVSCKYLHDTISNGEIIFIYNEFEQEDDEYFYIAYKSEDKLLLTIAFITENKESFELDLTDWSYPDTDILSESEEKVFFEKLMSKAKEEKITIILDGETNDK